MQFVGYLKWRQSGRRLESFICKLCSISCHTPLVKERVHGILVLLLLIRRWPHPLGIGRKTVPSRHTDPSFLRSCICGRKNPSCDPSYLYFTMYIGQVPHHIVGSNNPRHYGQPPPTQISPFVAGSPSIPISRQPNPAHHPPSVSSIWSRNYSKRACTAGMRRDVGS